jgi:hypothetical protein
MAQPHTKFMRWISRMIILSLLTMGLPLQPAFAGMVETDQTVSHGLVAQDRARISAFLDRKEVLSQLQSEGVTVGEAKARVNALTDTEVHMIAGKLDQLPAGGDFISILIVAFIITLISDILGYTDIFPFSHALRR